MLMVVGALLLALHAIRMALPVLQATWTDPSTGEALSTTSSCSGSDERPDKQ